MANDYYTSNGTPSTRSSLASSTMRAIFLSIELAFNKLPALVGQSNTFVRVNSTGDGLANAGLSEVGGKLLYGQATSRSTGGSERLVQVEAASGTSSYSAIRNSADALGASLVVGKSRAAAVGGVTIVQSGDTLGQVLFVGADGVDMDSVAGSIRVEVDGTPGSNDMPGRMVFGVSADGAAAATDRVTLYADGSIETTSASTSRPAFQVTQSNTAPGLKVVQTGSGNTAEFHDASGDTTPTIIDPAGVVVKGHTAAVTSRLGGTSITPPVQVLGVTASTSSSLVARYASDVTPAYLHLGKSRSTLLGVHSVVAPSDLLGAVSFVGSDGTNFTEASRVAGYVDGSPSADVMPGGVLVSVNTGGTTLTDVFKFTSARDSTHISPVGALGYGVGAGSSLLQLTSKATGVTMNRPNGQITMNVAALAAGAVVSFTLTNSTIGADDVVVPCIKSGATAGAYTVQVDAVAAGSCRISVRNQSAGSLSEGIVLQFAVLRGAIT